MLIDGVLMLLIPVLAIVLPATDPTQRRQPSPPPHDSTP